MDIMQSITLTNNEITRFKNLTKNYKHLPPHQYEEIRIKDGEILFILYYSKKLVYNENNSTLKILNKVLEEKVYNEKEYFSKYHPQQYNKKTFKDNAITLSDYKFTIGSDETGKGEWFGPLVVTGVCTSNIQNKQLREIGVTDSKKLSKTQITTIYNKIQELGILEETIVLRPFSYNNLYNTFKNKGKNLNHLLAYLHSKVIKQLIEQIESKSNKEDICVIIDKFDYKKMNEYLNIPDIKVVQETNGERYTPVATSSIIAKYHYEKTMNELNKRYNINLRKSKPKDIDKNIIDKVAKTHFKNIKPYTKNKE